mmetsp:Transcript_10037/g.40864  ORF Transcript_10037/g.40864 Transcript_10037/m.40864 type:complete len:220 (-) Transcript_10037:1492-2151(-)
MRGDRALPAQAQAAQMPDGLRAAEQPDKSRRFGPDRVQQGLLGDAEAGSRTVIDRNRLHLGAAFGKAFSQPIAPAVATQQQHPGAGPVPPLRQLLPQMFGIQARRLGRRLHDGSGRHTVRHQGLGAAGAHAGGQQLRGPAGTAGMREELLHRVGADKYREVDPIEHCPGSTHRHRVTRRQDLDQGQGRCRHTELGQPAQPSRALRPRPRDQQRHAHAGR